MTATAKEVAPGIRWTEGDVEIDAPLIARGLNLPTEQLVAEMRRGVVYSTSERGIGEDEGRSRLTFRYRSRVFRLIVTTSGEVVGEDISGSEDLRGGCGLKERRRIKFIASRKHSRPA